MSTYTLDTIVYTAVFSFCGIQSVFHPVSVKVHWFVEAVEKVQNVIFKEKWLLIWGTILITQSHQTVGNSVPCMVRWEVDQIQVFY